MHDSSPSSRQMKTILEGVSQSIHLWHFQAEFDAHDLTYALQMCATARVLKGVWQIVRMSKEGHKTWFQLSKQVDCETQSRHELLVHQFVMSFRSNEVKCERLEALFVPSLALLSSHKELHFSLWFGDKHAVIQGWPCRGVVDGYTLIPHLKGSPKNLKDLF